MAILENDLKIGRTERTVKDIIDVVARNEAQESRSQIMKHLFHHEYLNLTL